MKIKTTNIDILKPFLEDVLKEAIRLENIYSDKDIERLNRTKAVITRCNMMLCGIKLYENNTEITLDNDDLKFLALSGFIRYI